MNLPKREELSLRTVLALPNDSKIGEHCCNRLPHNALRCASSVAPRRAESAAKYFTTIFDASVLPLPDSPETKINCCVPSRASSWYVLCACAQECGRLRSMRSPSARYFGISLSWYHGMEKVNGLNAT